MIARSYWAQTVTFAATAAVGGSAAVAQVPARESVEVLRQELGRPGDRYLDIHGVRVRYRDEGPWQREAPVLLLLHGSRGTLDGWDGVANALKDRYRVIRYDNPPTGLSGPVSDAAVRAIGTPEAFAAALLDRLGVKTATVVGVSSGGTLAYYFAASYPERVDALILSNAPSDPVSKLKPPSTPALDAALASAKATGVEGRDFWQAYLTFLYGDPARLKPATIDYYARVNLRRNEPNKFKLHALTAEASSTMAHLHSVKARTLILWGERDPVLTATEARSLVAHLDGSKGVSFVGMPDVGHYPPMEVPMRFAAMVDAYLKAIRP